MIKKISRARIKAANPIRIKLSFSLLAFVLLSELLLSFNLGRIAWRGYRSNQFLGIGFLGKSLFHWIDSCNSLATIRSKKFFQAGVDLLLISALRKFIFKNGLQVSHAKFQTQREFGFLHMNGKEFFLSVECQIDFIPAIFRCCRAGRSKDQKE